jgi:hypothetical protein
MTEQASGEEVTAGHDASATVKSSEGRTKSCGLITPMTKSC